MNKIKSGKYQHFKGNFYEVIGIALDSETLKEYVVYKALYNSKEFGLDTLWIRERENFLGEVEVDGKKVPRFKRVR
jgi:hypothetical protein